MNMSPDTGWVVAAIVFMAIVATLTIAFGEEGNYDYKKANIACQFNGGLRQINDTYVVCENNRVVEGRFRK